MNQPSVVWLHVDLCITLCFVAFALEMCSAVVLGIDEPQPPDPTTTLSANGEGDEVSPE